ASQPYCLNIASWKSAFALSCGDPTWLGSDDICARQGGVAAVLINASKRCSSACAGADGCAAPAGAEASANASAARLAGCLIIASWIRLRPPRRPRPPRRAARARRKVERNQTEDNKPGSLAIFAELLAAYWHARHSS